MLSIDYQLLAGSRQATRYGMRRPPSRAFVSSSFVHFQRQAREPIIPEEQNLSDIRDAAGETKTGDKHPAAAGESVESDLDTRLNSWPRLPVVAPPSSVSTPNAGENKTAADELPAGAGGSIESDLDAGLHSSRRLSVAAPSASVSAPNAGGVRLQRRRQTLGRTGSAVAASARVHRRGLRQQPSPIPEGPESSPLHQLEGSGFFFCLPLKRSESDSAAADAQPQSQSVHYGVSNVGHSRVWVSAGDHV